MDTNNSNQFDGFNQQQQNPQQQQFQANNQQQQQFNQQQFQQYNQFNQQQQYGQNQYSQQPFNPQQQFNSLPKQENKIGNIAVVLAFVSIICCGGPFSILAIILGIVSLIKVGKNGKAFIAIILSVSSLIVWIILYIVLGSAIYLDFLHNYTDFDSYLESESDYNYNSDLDSNNSDTYDYTETETVEPEVNVDVSNSTEEYDLSTVTNFPVEYDKIGLVEFTTPDGTNYTIDVQDMSTIINCDLLREDENLKTTLEQYERESFSFFDVNDDWDSFTFFCYNSAEEPVDITKMKTSDIHFDGLMDLPYFKIDGFVDNTITDEQFLELMGEPTDIYDLDKETNRVHYTWYRDDDLSVSPTETSDCQIMATFEQGKLDSLSFCR